MPIVIHELIVRAQVNPTDNPATSVSDTPSEASPSVAPETAQALKTAEEILAILKRKKER